MGLTVAACAMALAAPAAPAAPLDPFGRTAARDLDPFGGARPGLRRLAAPSPDGVAPEPRPDPDSLLVRFAPGADARSAAAASHGRLGGPVGRTDWRVVHVDPAARDAARAALRRDRRVLDVEPNLRRTASLEPNDPWLAKGGTQVALRMLRAPQAWSLTTGSSTVRIAVLDTGVDPTHPDLAGKLLPGRDVVYGDGDPRDENGHGTLVTGIAAAATGNGRGMAGLGWNTRVIPVQVLGPDGSGLDSDVAAGITWAADAGADVINISFGGPGDSQALRDAVTYAMGKGALVVAAAGNEGLREPEYPAAIPDVLAVGASQISGDVAWFSTHGPWIDLVAPGVEVMGAWPVADGPIPYATASGTSVAAPLASATAALVAAQHPDWTPAALAARLRDTATDRGPPGIDPFYGAGGLDTAAAVGAARRPVEAMPTAGPNEPNDVPDRAARLAADAEIEDVLSPEGDVDWFAVDVPEAGWQLAYVDSTLPDHGYTDLPQVADPTVDVYVATNLSPVQRVDEEGVRTGRVERAQFHAHAAGRYLVRVGNRHASRMHYRIHVRPTTPLDEDARFHTATEHLGGYGPHAVAVADVTGDGRPDALGVTDSTHTVDDELPTDYSLVVRPQDVDGWLARREVHHVHGAPERLATGDLDGDGDADVAVSTTAGVVDLFTQQAGELTMTQTLEAPGARHVAIADLEGDGRNEIVVAAGGRHVDVLSRATGAWQRRRVSSPGGVEDIEIADVTGDGRRDLVTAPSLSVVAQRSDGTFAQPVRYDAMSTYVWCCEGLAVADMNGDGRRDVLVTQGGNEDESLSVLPQRADGTLGVAKLYRSFDIPGDVATADVTGDGRADAVVVHEGWEQVGLYEQRADGTLGPERLYRTPYVNGTSQSLALADVTSDGRRDIVLGADTVGLTVLRQQATTPPLRQAWVRGTTPASVAQGAATGVRPSIRFGRAMDAASVGPATVALANATAGTPVAATVAYDAATRVATVTPAAALTSGHTYTVTVDGVRDGAGRRMPQPFELRFTVGSRPADAAAPDTLMFAGTQHRDDIGGFFISAPTEAGARLECNDTASTWWGPCPEHHDPSWWYPGMQVVRVRAIDAAGRVDPSPVRRTWEQPDGHDYAANWRADYATVLTGSSGTATGHNFSANKYWEEEPYPGDNPGGSNVWWSWTAPTTGTITFDTAGSDFDTLLGAYRWTGDYGSRFIRVAENDDAGGATTSRITFTAQAGTTYWIAVDGFNDGASFDMGRITLNWGTGTPARAVPVTGTTADLKSTSAVVHGSIDSNGLGGTWWFEYGTTTSYGSSTPATTFGAARRATQVWSALSSLSPATEYHFRLVVSAGGVTLRGADQTFGTNGRAPTVTTGRVENLRPGRARVWGSVVSSDGSRCACGTFQYGTTTAYRSTAEARADLSVAPSADLRGLRGSTTYHYRLGSWGPDGDVFGADRTFTTPAPTAPQVSLSLATAIRDTSAELLVRPVANGAPTTAWIEYGTSTAYGSRTASVDLGLTPREEETLKLSGLAPGTTYQFRVAVQSSAGTTRGAAGSLTTEPAPPTVTTQAPASPRSDGATLSARANPNGLPTRVWFEYRSEERPSWSDPDATAASDISGTGEQTVTTRLAGLEPARRYFVRAVAENSSGLTRGAYVELSTLKAPPRAETEYPSRVSADDAEVRGKVDAGGAPTTAWAEFGTTTAYGSRSATVDAGDATLTRLVRPRLTGLRPGTTYHWRIVAQNALGTATGADQTFTTPPDARPDVEYAVAEDVGTTSATIETSIDPNGLATTWRIEYGKTEALGSATALRSAGAGTAPASFSAALGGLEWNTEYHYRLTATNSAGAASLAGTLRTSAPPPRAVTRAASALTAGGATLNGTVNPNAAPVWTRFEYGRTTRYGTATPWREWPAGRADVALSAAVGSLEPSATYHFRLVADSFFGRTEGADMTFTTPAAGG